MNIYEPMGVGEDYPVVQHNFFGRTKNEALHYFDSHMKTDAFLREGIEKGKYRGITLAIDHKMIRMGG